MREDVRRRGGAAGRDAPQASGGPGVNNEFWLPSPPSGPIHNEFLGSQSLTPEERSVLRRLRRGARSRQPQRGASGIRHRAALRRRRRALDNLRISDLRSLLQIVMELGL